MPHLIKFKNGKVVGTITNCPAIERMNFDPDETYELFESDEEMRTRLEEVAPDFFRESIIEDLKDERIKVLEEKVDMLLQELNQRIEEAE